MDPETQRIEAKVSEKSLDFLFRFSPESNIQPYLNQSQFIHCLLYNLNFSATSVYN